MGKGESLFVLLTKNKRKKIFLRQRMNGTYYFSQKKQVKPKLWSLKNVYIENDEVTLRFIETKTQEERRVTVISNPRLEKTFYLIEPSRFAPFQHEAKIYDTTKRIELMEQEDKLKSQRTNILIVSGLIIVLLSIIFWLFVF